MSKNGINEMIHLKKVWTNLKSFLANKQNFEIVFFKDFFSVVCFNLKCKILWKKGKNTGVSSFNYYYFFLKKKNNILILE